MNALASRQLGSADKAFGVHQVAHTQSGFYHRIPCHSLTSVEVDYDLVGCSILDLRIPGMQLGGPFRRARGTLQDPPPNAVFPGRLRAFRCGAGERPWGCREAAPCVRRSCRGHDERASVAKMRQRFLPDPCPIGGELFLGGERLHPLEAEGCFPAARRRADSRSKEPAVAFTLDSARSSRSPLKTASRSSPLSVSAPYSTSAPTSGSTKVARSRWRGLRAWKSRRDRAERKH